MTEEKEFSKTVKLPVSGVSGEKILTNSYRHTFLDCQAKAYYQYERRLSPQVQADYFVWGGYFHYAREWLEKGKSIEEIQDKLRESVEKEAQERNLTTKVLLQREGFILLLPYVMDAYLLHFKDDIGKHEVIASEKEFQISLELEDFKEGWIFQGKIDEIVRDTSNGVLYIRDTKTPGSTGWHYFMGLPLDSQLKGYILGAQRGIGLDVNFCMYETIQKPPAQKNMECEDPEKWAEVVGTQYLIQHEKLFERKILEFKQQDVDAYYVEQCLLAKQIDWHRSEGIWIQHHPKNRFGGCPYYNLCVNGETESELSKFHVRSPEEFHPELSEEN